MNTRARMKLAVKGDREARGILIRDLTRLFHRLLSTILELRITK